MDTAIEITVEVPLRLLRRAQEASGAGITETVRIGLQLIAASGTYANLRKLRGKVRFSRTAAGLKADRLSRAVWLRFSISRKITLTLN